MSQTTKANLAQKAESRGKTTRHGCNTFGWSVQTGGELDRKLFKTAGWLDKIQQEMLKWTDNTSTHCSAVHMRAGERLPGSSTHPYLQHTPSSSSFQFQTVSFTPPTCFFPCTSPSSSNPYLQYDAKPQLFLQKVSSKLGPSIRQQDRGLRPEQEPSGQGSGQDILRPLTASSELRQGVSPRRARQSLGMLPFPT